MTFNKCFLNINQHVKNIQIYHYKNNLFLHLSNSSHYYGLLYERNAALVSIRHFQKLHLEDHYTRLSRPNKSFTIVLDQNADVARPDKISGADINSICQEVS